MGKEKTIGIIGAGPGGYTAAQRLVQMGAKVLLFEKDQPGGTCLNRGCIPTKCLLSSAHALENAKSGNIFGFTASDIQGDIRAMVEKKDQIISRQLGGLKKSLSSMGIQIITGKGTINKVDPLIISCDGRDYPVDGILIATGSEPLILPGFKVDGQKIVTSTEIMNITTLPEKLLVIGAGFVGLELGSWLACCGSKVTVAEALPVPLPSEEPDFVKRLLIMLKRSGLSVLANTKASFEGISDDGKVQVKLGDKADEFDMVLLAAGRRISLPDMPENLELERGRIGVDQKYRTNIPGIWACGDCTGGIMLAHVASSCALVAADDMGDYLELEKGHFDNDDALPKISGELVPSCIYTMPEMASIGLKSHQNPPEGVNISISDIRLASNGRAAAARSSEGMIRLISDEKTNRILGGTILAATASEMIHQLALAIRMKLTAEQLHSCIFAHPTVSESIFEATEKLIFKE